MVQQIDDYDGVVWRSEEKMNGEKTGPSCQLSRYTTLLKVLTVPVYYSSRVIVLQFLMLVIPSRRILHIKLIYCHTCKYNEMKNTITALILLKNSYQTILYTTKKEGINKYTTKGHICPFNINMKR